MNIRKPNSYSTLTTKKKPHVDAVAQLESAQSSLNNWTTTLRLPPLKCERGGSLRVLHFSYILLIWKQMYWCINQYITAVDLAVAAKRSTGVAQQQQSKTVQIINLCSPILMRI